MILLCCPQTSEVEKMKKLRLGMGILLLLAIVLPVSAAPAIQKVTGGGWYVYSDGSHTTKSFTVQVDAQGNVKGKWVVNSYIKEGTFRADVTSLQIIGNRAIIGGRVTDTPEDSGVPVGEKICMVVVDNGQGKNVDKISITYEEYELEKCNTWPLPDPLNDYIGDIQISGPNVGLLTSS